MKAGDIQADGSNSRQQRLWRRERLDRFGLTIFRPFSKTSAIKSTKVAIATNEDRSTTIAALPAIQALRAVAALAVVVAHTGGEFEGHLSLPGLMPSFIHGGAGVDLFFVISGFVMVYSSERLFAQRGALRTFLIRRFIRIVPLYWLFTTVMLLSVLVRGFVASDASPTLAVCSYFFIPYPRPSGPIDPLYGVGWTLNYEMMFYLLFACSLFMHRNMAIIMTSLFLLVMTIIHSRSSLSAQLAFLTEPVILEFALGMLVALIFRAGVTLPRTACYALLAAAATLSMYFLLTAPPTRWLLWGLPSTMVVAAFTLAARPAYVPALFVALGNASYALYLVHPASNFVVRHAAQRGLFFNPATEPWLYLLCAICFSVLVASALYYLFERSTTRFLRGLFRTD